MPIRYIANKIERFLIYRILHVDDTPRRIALGLAIGIFVTWTPTIPCQMVLVVALSALFGANKLVGVPFVWISNPVTMWFMFWIDYRVGCAIIGSDAKRISAFVEAINLTGAWHERLLSMWNAFGQFFWELAIGSILVGLVSGLIAYFVTHRAVVGYRRIRRHHPWRWGHHKDQSATDESGSAGKADSDKTPG